MTKFNYAASAIEVLMAVRASRIRSTLTELLSSFGLAIAKYFENPADVSSSGASADAVLILDLVFVGGRLDVRPLREAMMVSPELRALVVGPDIDDDAKHDLLMAGARGYLALPDDILFLVRAINEIGAGGLWFERSVLTRNILQKNVRCLWGSSDVAQDTAGSMLTPREKVIAAHVSQGLRNRNIAKKLNISEKTVKTHLSRAYCKLGVSSRVQLSLLLRHAPHPLAQDAVSPLQRSGARAPLLLLSKMETKRNRRRSVE